MGFLLMMIVLALGVLLVGGAVQRASGRRPVEGDWATAAQLDRMETALTALEARVEDLQEQQRFLERLLADRPEPRALSQGGAEASEPSGDSSPKEASAGGILFETGPSSTHRRPPRTGERAPDDPAEER